MRRQAVRLTEPSLSSYLKPTNVRSRPGYYEDGGVSGGNVPSVYTGNAPGQELVRAVNRVEDAVRSLPSRQYIGWD
jgi:hypothetical protein